MKNKLKTIQEEQARRVISDKKNGSKSVVINKKIASRDGFDSSGLVTANNKDTSENNTGNEKITDLFKSNNVSADKEYTPQNDGKNEYFSKLIFANEKKALELKIAFEKSQKEEKEKADRETELEIMNKELLLQSGENDEKAMELLRSNLKLVFNYEEREKLANDLNIAKKELLFQQNDKVKRAVELINANIKLVLNYEEKEKRETELVIANKELLYQSTENRKKSSELLEAIDDLVYLNEEKEKQASELIIANKELVRQNKQEEQRTKELTIVNDWYLQSEENFRRSISESPLGIRIVTMKGKTIYVNKAFLDMYEFNSMEEFESVPIVDWHTPESYTQHLKRTAIRKRGGEVHEYEKSMVSKNGEIRHVKVWRNEVLWNGVKHFQIINLDITEQKRAEEALKETQLELRKFATHLQNIREEEKISLSREIHDDLGQILVALKIDLGMFKKEISKGKANISSEEILTKFDQLYNLVDKTIKTTRRIMNGLRPELIELLGFIEAAKLNINEFQERLNIPCQFKCDIEQLNINQEQSVTLFRILQEALTNVAKHAQAKAVKIHLSIHNAKLILEISDNGIGFDEKQTIRPDSYGMIGMKERVFLLEGELFVTGKPGKGTIVRVEMPYRS